MRKIRKIFGSLVTLCVMVFAPAPSRAEETPQQVFCAEATRWLLVEETGWKLKCVNVLGARAMITQFKQSGALRYSVVRPCPLIERSFTMFWTPGWALMLGVGCNGKETTEPVAPWLPYFEDETIKFI